MVSRLMDSNRFLPPSTPFRRETLRDTNDYGGLHNISRDCNDFALQNVDREPEDFVFRNISAESEDLGLRNVPQETEEFGFRKSSRGSDDLGFRNLIGKGCEDFGFPKGPRGSEDYSWRTRIEDTANPRASTLDKYSPYEEANKRWDNLEPPGFSSLSSPMRSNFENDLQSRNNRGSQSNLRRSNGSSGGSVFRGDKYLVRGCFDF
jgi:hypothetical protein